MGRKQDILDLWEAVDKLNARLDQLSPAWIVEPDHRELLVDWVWTAEMGDLVLWGPESNSTGEAIGRLRSHSQAHLSHLFQMANGVAWSWLDWETERVKADIVRRLQERDAKGTR